MEVADSADVTTQDDLNEPTDVEVADSTDVKTQEELNEPTDVEVANSADVNSAQNQEDVDELPVGYQAPTRSFYNQLIEGTVTGISPRINADIASHLLSPGPLRAEDYDDETTYYEPAETIEDLLDTISVCTNLQCVEILRYLCWDHIRLMLRERLHDGKLTNAPRGKTFVQELILYHGEIDHPICKVLDQAAFLILHKRSAVYIHPNPVAVTGRAVEAAESLSKEKDLGPLEFDNPLYLIKNLTCDQISYVANQLLWNPTNRKTKNISRLAKLWKDAEAGNNLRLKQRMYEHFGKAFQFMTIESPISTHFRAVSTQILYQSKGSAAVGNHLLFRVLLTNCRPWHYYILIGCIPGRLEKEQRDFHIKSEGMVREKTKLVYPKGLKVFVDDQMVQKVYDVVGGELYPVPIDRYCKFGQWHDFYVQFDLEIPTFQRGLIFHLIQGELLQESYRKRED